MVSHATFNNISVILWQSVLLVEETRVPEENYWPVASYWQTLSHNVAQPRKICWVQDIKQFTVMQDIKQFTVRGTKIPSEPQL